MDYVQASPSGQDQMQVAKLVPEVTLAQRFLIGDLQVLKPTKGFEHGKVCRIWLMQAGQHCIDSTKAALRCNHQARPALARVGHSLAVGGSFERSHNCCAYSNDSPIRLVR